MERVSQQICRIIRWQISTVPEDPHPILRMRPGLQACEEHEFREFRQCRFLHPFSVRLRKPAYRF